MIRGSLRASLSSGAACAACMRAAWRSLLQGALAVANSVMPLLQSREQAHRQRTLPPNPAAAAGAAGAAARGDVAMAGPLRSQPRLCVEDPLTGRDVAAPTTRITEVRWRVGGRVRGYPARACHAWSRPPKRAAPARPLPALPACSRAALLSTFPITLRPLPCAPPPPPPPLQIRTAFCDAAAKLELLLKEETAPPGGFLPFLFDVPKTLRRKAGKEGGADGDGRAAAPAGPTRPPGLPPGAELYKVT